MSITLETPEGIMSLQRALNYACYYSEDKFMPVTGVLDVKTKRGIAEFQRIFDYPVTGTITRGQVTVLEQEMVRKNITEY